MTIPGQAAVAAAVALLAGVYVAGVGAVAFRARGRPGGHLLAGGRPRGRARGARAPRRWWPVLAAGLRGRRRGGRLHRRTGRAGLGAVRRCRTPPRPWSPGPLLRRGGRDRPQLDDQEDFVRLVEAALLRRADDRGGRVRQRLAHRHRLRRSRPGSAVFPSHAAAVLVLVPLAMTGREPLDRRPARRAGAAAARPAGRRAVVFAPQQPLPLTFMPLPFLVWAALRFDLRVVPGSWPPSASSSPRRPPHGRRPFGAGVRRPAARRGDGRRAHAGLPGSAPP